MISLTIPIKTTNPNNGSQGMSRGAAMSKARRRKVQRFAAKMHCSGAFTVYPGRPPLPADVTVTRLAPSNGLDPHDGLGAALKGVIDGVADALGLANDRDERVTWVLEQERSKTYGVRVEIRRRDTM